MDLGGRVWLPNVTRLRILVILEAHEPLFCGHLGVKRTRELVSRHWAWETMRKDVEKVVRSCDACQRFQNPSK